MICIIGAMEIEVKGLVELLKNKKEFAADKIYHVTGTLHGKKVVVVKSGIGKVNSAVATAFILSKFSGVKIVINIGVSGGIKPGIKQGDIVIATESCQHDFDLRPDGLPKGQLPDLGFTNFRSDSKAAGVMALVLDGLKYTYYKGTIASGDQFINSKPVSRELYTMFDAYAVDMETASIAHACYMLDVSYFAIRTMSDNADGSSVDDYRTFLQKAATRSIQSIAEFLKAYQM